MSGCGGNRRNTSHERGDRTCAHRARSGRKPFPVPAVVRAPQRRGSSKRATERAWLQDGFSLATPDLEDFLIEAAPQALCNTHRIAAVMFLALIGLASVLHVDIVVSGSGRLSADAPTIVSQPMQLSVIRRIRVKPGDIVHKGDVLAELDPTFTKADQATLVAQQSAIVALKTRLNAELDDAAPQMIVGAAGRTRVAAATNAVSAAPGPVRRPGGRFRAEARRSGQGGGWGGADAGVVAAAGGPLQGGWRRCATACTGRRAAPSWCTWMRRRPGCGTSGTWRLRSST